MHRLLMSPARRVLDNTFRMPAVQEPTRAIGRNLHETLMDRDSLRRIKRSMQSNKLSGPMPTPHVFTRAAGGQTNDPAAMASGAHKMNARRLVNKTSGRTAGT